MLTIFQKLAKGEKFTVAGDEAIWQKVKPVKKGGSCCGKLDHNAVEVGGDKKRAFGPGQKVNKV